MRLSNLADYAVVLMSAAARQCGSVPIHAGMLAEQTGIPGPTAQKLVSQLARAGLLVASRGSGGGVRLARPAAAISVADIIEAVAGALPETGGELEVAMMVRREDGSWLVDGGLGIDESEDKLGITGLRGLSGFDTVAGYALFRLGRLPVIGDTFSDRTGHYEIVDMDGRRIDKIAYRPRGEEEG